MNIKPRCSPQLPGNDVENSPLGTYVGFNPDTSDPKLPLLAAQLKVAVPNVNVEAIEELKGENEHVRFVEILKMSMERFSDFKIKYYLSRSMCNSGTKEADFVEITFQRTLDFWLFQKAKSLKRCFGKSKSSFRMTFRQEEKGVVLKVMTL